MKINFSKLTQNELMELPKEYFEHVFDYDGSDIPVLEDDTENILTNNNNEGVKAPAKIISLATYKEMIAKQEERWIKEGVIKPRNNDTITDISTKEELLKVANHVYEVNQYFYNAVGGYFNIPNDTYELIMTNLLKPDGTICKFTLASKVYAIYSLFVKTMQNNRNKDEDKRNDNMHDEYENSSYWTMTNIYDYFKVDHKIIDECIELLISNGYICRKIGNERTKNNQPKYYFYVLLQPNIEFTVSNSDSKMKKPKAFGGVTGKNAIR